MTSTTSRLRKAIRLPGEQSARFFVPDDGLLEVLQHFRPYALPGDKLAPRCGEQAGHVPCVSVASALRSFQLSSSTCELVLMPGMPGVWLTKPVL